MKSRLRQSEMFGVDELGGLPAAETFYEGPGMQEPVAFQNEGEVLKLRVELLESQLKHEKKLTRKRKLHVPGRTSRSGRIGISMSLDEARELDAFMTAARRQAIKATPGVISVHARLFKYVMQRMKTEELVDQAVKP